MTLNLTHDAKTRLLKLLQISKQEDLKNIFGDVTKNMPEALEYAVFGRIDEIKPSTSFNRIKHVAQKFADELTDNQAIKNALGVVSGSANQSGLRSSTGQEKAEESLELAIFGNVDSITPSSTFDRIKHIASRLAA